MLQTKKLLKFKLVKHFFLNSQDTRNLNSFVRKTDKIMFCKQIHGKAIAHIPSDTNLDIFDGMITRQRGIFLAVKTADCIPMLLCDGISLTIAAVHAGWSGLYKGIIPEVIEDMEKMNCKKKDIVCAIGPHIGKCCYNATQQRFDMLKSISPHTNFWRLEKDTIYIDLAEIAYQQLRQSGVSHDNIDIFNICTKCNKEYDSYRRDKDSCARMFSIIGLVA